MPTFIARSGSFNNLRVTGSLSASGSVFLESLTNTAQTNVVTFNTSSGQLFYVASESIRVTSASYAVSSSYALSSSYTPLNITNNTRGNMLVSSGSTSVIQGVREVNFDYLYDAFGAGIGVGITPTLIISGGLAIIGSGSKLEYIDLSSNKTNTSSSRNIFMFGEGLISQKSNTYPNETQIVLGRFNNTGSNIYGTDPSSQVIFAIGAGENNTNRIDAIRVFRGGNVFTSNLQSDNIYSTILSSPSITGSLFGTSSWASRAVSSSYAITASYALNAGGGGGGTPGGSNKQIQFNSGSTFSGSSNFIYDYITDNLIYNAPDNLSVPRPEYINNPDNSLYSVLIGLGLTGSYIEPGYESYYDTSITLGLYNSYHSFSPSNTLYNINTFVVGNGYYDFANVIRENAIEIGRNVFDSIPYIKLPQLISSNPGYVVTFDTSSKQLSYSVFNVVGGSDKQIQFNNNGTLAGATGFNYITGSSNVLQFTGSFTVSSSLNVIGTSRVTGSLNISGSEYIRGSGSAIFKTDGTVGPLLTVNDSNSGSLFSVNDISGLPIVDIRSDGSTLIGSSTAPSLTTTKKVVSTAAQAFALGGTLIPTASYDGAFFEYIAKSGSNARSGYITATWSGSSIVSSSITSSDIGTTTGLTTFVAISSSYIVLSGSANAANWTVKSIIRAI